MKKTYTPLLTGALLFSKIFTGGCSEVPGDRTGSTTDQPNIIYILADDLGYGDLGSYGQEHIRTPNLDRMARQGMRFTQHYAASTVCAPSRSALMTGLHTGHTQIRGNRKILPIGQYPLQFGTVTIPRLLKHAGYATGAFGKWGLGYPGSEGVPSLQGFDEFFGFLCQRRAHFFYPEFLFHDSVEEGLRQVRLEGNEVDDTPVWEGFQHPGSGRPVERRHYSANVIHDRALDFIRKSRDEPFFLYYPTQIPHASLTVPRETLKLYLDDDGNSIYGEDPPSPGHFTEQPMPKAAYAAMVTHLDRQVGEIMELLEEKKLAENTLLIFTSDNGSHTAGGYHYDMLESNAPLRGGKRDLYEGGIRVPTIAWWPGTVAAGAESDHISASQDMLPTFAELADVTPPPGMDGISMVAELTGSGEQPEHEYLYWEFHEQGGKQAVRKENWKAVRLDVTGPEEVRTELYDLENDISEEHDIAEQHPDIVARMEEIMENAHIPSELFPLFGH